MKKYFILGLLAAAFIASNLITPNTLFAGDKTDSYQNDCCFYNNNNR